MVATEVISREAMLGNAEAFDSGNDVSSVVPADDSTPANPVEAKTPAPASAEEPEPAAAEKSATTEAVKDSSKVAESDKPKSKWAANEDRKSRSWKEINSEKETLKSERETFLREREQLNTERSMSKKESQSAADDNFRDSKGYTQTDYENAASSFDQEGEVELAASARNRIQGMKEAAVVARQKNAEESFKSQWFATYEKLAEKDASLRDGNSDTYKGVTDILHRFPLLKSSHDGLVYAYEAVRLGRKGLDADATVAENIKLKAELDKLKRKLVIGGSAPTEQLEGEKSFDKLDKVEQRKRLLLASEQFDGQPQ